MRAAVITAIYDDYDELKPALQQDGDDEVDFVCVSDVAQDKSLGWRIVHESRVGVHPNRAAKSAKMCPWRYTDAGASVWVDASFRITSPRFVQEVLAYANPLAQFRHPWRDCIFEEAEESLQLAKYADEHVAIQWQVAAYQLANHPEHWGLWAGGVVAREHTWMMHQLGSAWLEECTKFSYQDQISEALVLRMLGLRPTELPGDHFHNPWLAYEGSGRH